MLKDFREFILRGSLVELAVAVVMGTAFEAVVSSLVKGLITPLIAAVGGQPDFSELVFTVNGSKFLYGTVGNALLSFLIIAAVVFFLIIKPMNALTSRFATETAVDIPTRTCPHCLSDIPAPASRCAFCTSEVQPQAEPA